MSDSAQPTEHADVVVPVKVPQPADHAPPSLAEPASGPVAEMHGALTHEDGPATSSESKPTETPTKTNGAPQPTEAETEQPAEEVSTATPSSTRTEVMDPPIEEVMAARRAEQAAQAEHPPSAADPDSEMKDSEPAADPAPTAPVTTTEPNGASVSKPKRKSSTGVPEHKTKTLKKKQSKAKMTNLDAKPGDYYLARLRSYPPWPSIICDEEMLPEVLLNSRPVTAKQKDGTYKEPYADDGKKVTDRTFPIMFLFTNEFAWIPNTDLSPTDPESCKDVPEKNKAKALVEAFKVASEGHDLDHFKEMLRDHEAALQADSEAKAAAENEKAEKAAKKKRKSEVKADEDVEMEDAAEAPKKKSSKKRKKDAESDEEEPEKTPKTTKLKLTTGKTPTTDKKTDKKTPKPKADKKKKAAPESEEEAEPEKEEAPPLDPVEARKAREKEVLFLRHKLQKGFLSRDQQPSEDEMPQMVSYVKKLEAYGGDLEVAIIRTTKINKVLKGIIKLVSIPKDEEYRIRERSVALLGIWNQILGAEPVEADKPLREEKEKESPTTTNGVHKEAEEKAEEKIEPQVEESKENTLPAAEAVEKISAEVPADAGEKAAAVDAIETSEKPIEELNAGDDAGKETAPAAEIQTEDKAPESAGGAAVATETVKANE